MNELLNKVVSLTERLNKALKALDLIEDKKKLKTLEKETVDPNFWSNKDQAQNTMQEISDLKKHIETWENICDNLRDISELAKLTSDDEEQNLKNLKEHFDQLEKEYNELEFELLLSGEHDSNNAILQIHAGTGGTDAQDWAEMLLRMYLRYSERKSFTAKVIQESQGEEAGLKSATVEIKGYFAYGYLKSERGVHRLVRLSPFNSDHARQTSFALVQVIPEVEESKFKIDEKDLKIETFRSSGHGGQSVNTTDSAVRITHLPTGLTASCQNERSQLQNRQMAMKVLKSKLALLEEQKNADEKSRLQGENVSAEWGNQIRSYVLHPYNLVKDHRTGAESTDTTSVLNGEIDLFVEAFLRAN